MNNKLINYNDLIKVPSEVELQQLEKLLKNSEKSLHKKRREWNKKKKKEKEYVSI